MGLSPEEKKAKKEAKRLAKLAAEEEVRKNLKRDELKRELKAQEKNKAKLDQTYKDLMTKIKEPIFRQDTEIMWRTFERAYDKKDHLVSLIMHLMDIADDQFQRTVASFCDTVDTMINKFLSDLEELSKQNDQTTSKLLKSGEIEASTIMKDHNTAETHLQLLLYTADQEADTFIWAARGENLVKEDEERTKYSNDRENLKSFLENDYNNMWDQYKAVLKNYVTETADNQKKVRKLRSKENKMADIIASQGKRIANNDGVLKRLRTEMLAYESGTKQAIFRDRRDRHRAACHILKQRLTNGVNLDNAQLTLLVKSSESALEWLTEAHKKGEKILRMASLCRKFETRREKVLPYGTAAPHSPVQARTHVRKVQSDDSLVVNAISTTSGLTRMWQRVAKAELTKRALLREKELLIQENELIEFQLKELKQKRKMQPSSEECLVKTRGNQMGVDRPNAVDGMLEVAKMEKYYPQYK